MATMADLTAEALTELINHVFLPPKLPQQEDSTSFGAFMRLSLAALREFSRELPAHGTILEDTIGLLATSLSMHGLAENNISAPHLRAALEAGGPVFLHVRAQNAGILITYDDNGNAFVEQFELSAHNEAVMTTKGRLVRTFPGSAVFVHWNTASDGGFRTTLADTISVMCRQPAPQMQPQVKKTGQFNAEFRDTTHPGLVSELLVGFLKAAGEPVRVTSIQKCTRDDCLWDQVKYPWRRSPAWLLIKVSLQLTLSRSTGCSATLYKQFMAYLLAYMLRHAVAAGLPAELLYVMNAKVARRLEKLKHDVANPLAAGSIHKAILKEMRNASQEIKRQWAAIRGRQPRPLTLSRTLSRLNLERDTLHDLPGLDRYLETLHGRSQISAFDAFTPPSKMGKLDPSSLPSAEAKSNDVEYAAASLQQVEAWITSNLEEWGRTNCNQKNACAQLRDLMTEYHVVAQNVYSDNPEAMSWMLLTILEIWVMCDRIATHNCPLLLKYDPGIPSKAFQNLLLPLKAQMDRLSAIETHLAKRSATSVYSPDKLFALGSCDAFAVQYFDQSQLHQAMLQRINTKARSDKDGKLAEFENAKAEYSQLMGLYNRTECDYEDVVIEIRDGVVETEPQHDPEVCRTCGYHSSAQSLELLIFEAPLPDDMIKAKAMVFELEVPSWYSNWRDARTFLLRNILRGNYSTSKPREEYLLSKDLHLSSLHYKTSSPRQRIVFLSQDKPSVVTHYAGKKVGMSSESDICKNSGVNYQYYDSHDGLFVGDVHLEQTSQLAFVYKLPGPLRRFIFRPADPADDRPSSNLVIASQSQCPEDMTLEEYKELCELPLGYNIQWHNILLRLTAPSIDFKKVSTTLVFLQCIYQTGPPNGASLRQTHTIIRSDVFAAKLLAALVTALTRVKANWESSQALCIFTAIASRLLSLSPSKEIQSGCLTFLNDAREVAFNWVNLLRDKAADAAEHEERTAFTTKAVEVALICGTTLDVDAAHLHTILESSDNASILIQLSIVVQEGGLTSSPEALFRLLRLRFRRLLHRAYTELSQNTQGVDLAIGSYLPIYRPGTRCRVSSPKVDYWLAAETLPEPDNEPTKVHYNLLTGELLVNGSALNRPPKKYEDTSLYKVLFGRAAVAVMPSTVSGMRFSTKRPEGDCAVHLNLTDSGDLLVQTSSSTKSHETVPSRLLQEEFPTFFGNEFVHFYDSTSSSANDVVEFRPVDDPWNNDSQDIWRLTRLKGWSGWRMTRSVGDETLISRKSETSRIISRTLRAVARPEYLHITLQKSRTAEVEIPSLRLGFSLDQTDGSLRSHQYREMQVDDDQSLDTLIGFGNKLLLRTSSNKEAVRRMVLIPEAPVSCCSDDLSPPHTQVTISRSNVGRVHAFGVDAQLGRLTGSGSLESRLFLALLHAMTTFCLPDGLTGRTGTEQALEELNSAAVRSFDRLTQDNVLLLKQIADLTPGRSWYPVNKRVMQRVKWDSRIGFLAQHGRFYTTVASIFEQAKRSDRIFYPDLQLKFPPLNQTSTSLLERDLIRSSSFRVSGFGAEDHNTLKDINYAARDCDQGSQRSHNAYLTSSFVLRDTQELQWSMQDSHHLWDLVKSLPKITGPSQPVDLANLSYDVSVLSDWQDSVLKHWPGLHEAMRDRRNRHKFNIMIWLSTIGFAENVDLQVLQTLAALVTCENVYQVPVPAIDAFDPSCGKLVKTSDLKDVINNFSIDYVETIKRGDDEKFRPWEARQAAAKRQHKKQVKYAVHRLAAALTAQGCCAVPTAPPTSSASDITDFIMVDSAIVGVKPLFKKWYENSLLHMYLHDVESAVCDRTVRAEHVPAAPPANLLASRSSKGYISIQRLFENTEPPEIPTDHQVLELPPKVGKRRRSASHESPLLDQLIKKLRNSTGRSEYKQGYVQDLAVSFESLCQRENDQYKSSDPELQNLHRRDLVAYLTSCQQRVETIFDALRSAVKTVSAEALLAYQFPRVSQLLFLCQLSHSRWPKLKPQWQAAIAEYGLALTMLQRAQRILRVFDRQDSSIADLVNELQNTGHKTWNPLKHPQSLLIEVEGGIMIRDVQESIASEMRSPRGGRNSSMQLNMGQGKSSLIVPIVSCALADRSQLVRVIVAKPQSKQMADMLRSKLGGAVGRRVYYMPFSRSLKFDQAAADTVLEICKECMCNGGVLLVQPEHILSSKLMALECFMTNKEEIGRSLQRTQDFFESTSRDIVDESDENFSVKFELIYTMGVQRSIEGSPDRWLCIQQVLDLVRTKAPSVLEELGSSFIEIHDNAPGTFPRIRTLRHEAESLLLHYVARHICDFGLDGFPLGRQTKTVQDDVYAYMMQLDPSSAVIDAVETGRSAGFWSDSTKSTLFLLRGLLGGGVLAFAFGQKRWRVNFGLANRSPATQLAVPFRAKDSPSPRSEFSHPDVVIALTSLCYYYGGLDDEDLFTALGHLVESDQKNDEYGAWFRDANNLDKKFKVLDGINLKDRQQCVSQLFPSLRTGKAVVDYFLSRIVFPKEMKEFPQKLSASGWDIGKCKARPTTGFSGTNDSRIVLPIDVHHLDLDDHKHTNALVLENILRPENTVEYMPSLSDSDLSDAERILSVIMDMDSSPEVILDVGAQILELDNLQVAIKWLKMRDDHDNTKEAVVFVDIDDELSVVDLKGRVELLKTSSFASRLGACLIFLDEAHTRGMDLLMPADYRAAVTLGAHLTKDRLVQACMRLRKLGLGQSVVFLLSAEIQTKVSVCVSKSDNDIIDVSDVLFWAISETFAEMHKSMPLWAVQGERYIQQEQLWNRYSTNGRTVLSKQEAGTFLADEAQSIEQRYRARTHHADSTERLANDGNPKLQQISERCKQFSDLKFNSSALQEEQERELSPEIEQERQIQRAAPAKPEKHVVSVDVRNFALQGILNSGSQSYFPAFEALRETSGAKLFDVTSFGGNLLVTADFACTVAGTGSSYRSDQYQRSVQWVVSSCRNSITRGTLMIISPAEADLLAPEIALSKTTALHLYKPRCNSGYPTLDKLDLCTITAQPSVPIIPRMLIVQLGLFAGQLYISSFEDYRLVCSYLNLTVGATPQGWDVTPNGFIVWDGQSRRLRRENPVQFIKFLMTTVRRNGQGIAKTDMGGLLEGKLFEPSHFEDQGKDVELL